ncbi:zinc finger protein GLI1-like [Cetorhinus maximus]
MMEYCELSPLLVVGALGEVSMSGMPLPPGLELSGSDPAVRSLLTERCSSTVSSAYTVSQHSSSLSLSRSSRRSSEASLARGPSDGSSAESHNLSSPGALQRFGEVGQCARLPGLPDLTLAQQYQLKAKQTAATGAALPTPLANMEPLGRSARPSFLSDRCSPAVPACPPPALPCQSGKSGFAGYGAGALRAHNITGINGRRVSDPVHMRVSDQAVPKVQQFNSIDPARVVRSRSLQHPAALETNLHRHIYSPRPPSITENVLMETVAMDTSSVELSDDIVLYTDCQEVNMASLNDQVCHSQTQGFHAHMDMHHQNLYSNRNPGAPQTFQQGSNITQQHYNVGQSHGSQSHDQLYAEENNIPIQWNKVSSGSMDIGPIEVPNQHSAQQSPAHLSQCLKQVNQGPHPSHQPVAFIQHHEGMIPNPHNVLSNSHRLRPVHQQQVKPEDQVYQSAPVLNPYQNLKHTITAQEDFSQSKRMLPTPRGMSCDSQDKTHSAQPSYFSTAMDSSPVSPPLGEERWTGAHTPMMMVRNYIQSQQALMWGQAQKTDSAEMPMAISTDSVEISLPQAMQSSPNGFTTQSQPYLAASYRNCQSQLNVFSPSSQESQIQAKMLMGPGGPQIVPHPPPAQRLRSRHSSLSPQHQYSIATSHTNPRHKPAEASPKRAVNLPLIPCHQDPPRDGGSFFSGQMQIQHGKSNFTKQREKAPGGIQQQQLDPMKLDSTLYTATTQMPHAINSLDLEHTQIDFREILDDEEHPSLIPGTLSPNIVANTPQTSSALPAPCNPLTLQTGMSNMAIGDMNSMLTTLAGESKFLTMSE